jgi:ankyrin repeat protein/uncharacterized caspase-like protein/WD40 repeat protein
LFPEKKLLRRKLIDLIFEVTLYLIRSHCLPTQDRNPDLMTLHTKGSIIALLCCVISHICNSQSHTLKPSLIPWHSGHSIKKMYFSPSGEHLITWGDDSRIVVTDLKKRLPLYNIDDVTTDFVVHESQPWLYAVTKGNDSLVITKTLIESGRRLNRTMLPARITDLRNNQTYYASEKPFTCIDYQTGQIFVPYSPAYGDALVIAVFAEDGTLIRRISGAVSGRLNALMIHQKSLYVLTSSALHIANSDELEKILQARGPANHFANLKAKGDTLALLSNKMIQWYNTRSKEVIHSADISNFFAQDGAGYSTTLQMSMSHPFVIDERGDCWIADTRATQQRTDRKTQRTHYQLAKVSSQTTYPLKAKTAVSLKSAPVDPLVAYHPPTGLFALIEDSQSLSVIIYHREHEELFRIGRKNMQISRIYFTGAPGRILIQAVNNQNAAGFFLDLGTGRIEPTGILDAKLTARFPDHFRHYQKLPLAEKVYDERTRRYERANYFQLEGNHYLNYTFTDGMSRSRKDSLKIEHADGTLILSKETGTGHWMSTDKKTVRKLQLRTTANREIRFDDFYFDKHQYDTISSTAVICYGNQQIGGDGLQYIIDLSKGRLLKQSTHQSVELRPGGKHYITERGLFLTDNDSRIAAFGHRPTLIYETDFAFTTNGLHMGYFSEEKVVIVNLEDHTEKVIGTHDGIVFIAADPHSTKLFTLSRNGTIKIWDPTLADEVASVYLEGASNFKQLKELNPSYLIQLPEGYYMGENRYYDILILRDGVKQYPALTMDVQFNRPDKVLRALGYADVAMIEGIERLADKRSSKKYTKLQADISIPNKRDIPFFATDKTISLKATVQKPTDDGTGMMVYVNGTALWPLPGKPVSTSFETTIALVDETNHVRVCLADAKGNESPGDYIVVGARSEEKRNLYVIGLGVSQYRDSVHNLKYAVKDMNDLVRYLKLIQSFGNVFTLELADREVTKNVEAVVKKFTAKARVQDAVLLYYAGHGLLDKNMDFYLSTYAMDFSNPSANGINIDILLDAIGGTAARNKVMLIDACNSGLIDDLATENRPELYIQMNDDLPVNTYKRGGSAETEVSQSLSSIYFSFRNFNSGNGVNVLAAAAGNESALEGGGVQNGLFTYSLIDGLKTGAADADQNEIITINELQRHVTQLVTRLSHGAQRPSFRQANLYTDMPLIRSSDSFTGQLLNAAMSNHLQTVRLLIENGEADIDAHDRNGFTALHYASREGNFTIARYLIDKGAGVSLSFSPYHFTPAYLAASNGHPRVLYLLIESGADVTSLRSATFINELRNKNHISTAAMLQDFDKAKASEQLHFNFIRLLAAENIQGADSLYRKHQLNVNHWLIREGTNALLAAIVLKKNTALNWLLTKKADLNYSTPDEGITPLMAAAATGNNEAIKILLDHGADKHRKDKVGKTAMDYASQAGNEEARQLLRP